MITESEAGLARVCQPAGSEIASFHRGWEWFRFDVVFGQVAELAIERIEDVVGKEIEIVAVVGPSAIIVAKILVFVVAVV